MVIIFKATPFASSMTVQGMAVYLAKTISGGDTVL